VLRAPGGRQARIGFKSYPLSGRNVALCYRLIRLILNWLIMKHAYAQRTWLKCNTLVRHNVPTARGAIYDQAAAVKGSDTASSW